jgi:hypothetical protein
VLVPKNYTAIAKRDGNNFPDAVRRYLEDPAKTAEYNAALAPKWAYD